jgi:DNA polymerase sigma
MPRIDECTEGELYDLLASLDVAYEELGKKQHTLEELRSIYRKMLAQQLQEWRGAKKYAVKMRALR